MNYTPAIASASTLTLLLVGSAFADSNPIESRALYSASSVLAFCSSTTLAELKVSPSQLKEVIRLLDVTPMRATW